MMIHQEQRALVEQVLATKGATLEGNTLVLEGGRQLEIPELPPVKELADMPSALPSRARGDSREKVLYNVAQDLCGLRPRDRQSDEALWSALGDRLGADRASQRILSSVMRKQYRVEPQKRAGATGSPFITPFHALLPGAFDYHGRYKSFRGSLLLFICWDGDSFDLEPISDLAEFLSEPEGLTLLDHELLRVATELIEEKRKPKPVAAAKNLEGEYGEQMAERLSAGAFDPVGLRRIKRDLRTVLQLRLPHHDKVAALVQCLSINLALYYYRFAFALGAGLDSCVAAGAGLDPGAAPDFSGRLLFRVGSGGDRPVKQIEPCAQSFLELDARYLYALPASMATANALHIAAVSAGLVQEDSLPNPHGLAVVLNQSDEARRVMDALAGVLCLAIPSPEEAPRAAQRAAGQGNGCFALREAVLDDFRSRGDALKQRGRDVVHTLVGGYVGGLKRSRGPVNFFELDEAVLNLLVQLALASSGEPRLNFRDDFLPTLAEYGLRPQDSAEEVKLAEALERLGLLRRYSDAGEALYVSNT